MLAFYRGAGLAALGRKDEAKSQFQSFLRSQPNASLDPGMYPKKVIAAFEEARKSVSAAENSHVTSVEAAYRAFPASTAPEAETPGDEWAEGPVRFLMTSGEKDEFLRRSDPRSRSEFVTAFWKLRDPKPETPENELRQEFEKRVAFADAHFVQGETRGSLTDRGMVFVLVGPPTYVGRKPLGADEDVGDPAGLTKGRPSDARIAVAARARESDSRKVTSADRAAAADRASGPGATMTDASRGWREVWHYRHENLPTGVPYLQVDFQFLTKRGYGDNVLQREPQALDTLERAKTLLRRPA